MTGRGPYRKGDEIREAILRAAEDLLATRSPSEVSLREIARHGGFQHSLITRHFGTKDDLVAAVVQRTLDTYVDAIRQTGTAVDGFREAMDHVAAHPASFQAMARALIDQSRGSAVDDPSAAFEIHRSQVADACVGGQDRADLDVLTVALMAFTSGWAFMEDRWLRTAGFSDADRADVREQISELVVRLIERP